MASPRRGRPPKLSETPMASDLIRERTGRPPYVTPYLDALDRMQERANVRPHHLTERCRSILTERFGGGSEEIEATFAHGVAGLIGDHTHYFDGFGVLMSLPLGTAVAARGKTDGPSRLTFEGGAETWDFDTARPSDADGAAWARLVQDIFHRLAPSGASVDVTVFSVVPPSNLDGYLSALGVAAARTAQALFSLPESTMDILHLVRNVIEACTGYPFSIAHLIASDTGSPEQYTLVDTHTMEHLALEAPTRDVLGCGLVDVGMEAQQDAAFHVQKREAAAEAAAILRQNGFPRLASLRDLEHKDLKAALGVLPRRLKPSVRHLVTENRRVQKLVVAVRRRDWQMFGALLLMSHSSHQKDWGSTNELLDAVVHETETMSIEGMYGACVTGRGGCVLAVGQPFIVPRCLDRIHSSVEEQFHIRPNVMLL